jgi:hypothetical protein
LCRRPPRSRQEAKWPNKHSWKDCERSIKLNRERNTAQGAPKANMTFWTAANPLKKQQRWTDLLPRGSKNRENPWQRCRKFSTILPKSHKFITSFS